MCHYYGRYARSACFFLFFFSIFLLILNGEDVRKDKQMVPLSLKILIVLIFVILFDVVLRSVPVIIPFMLLHFRSMGIHCS